MLFSLNFKSSVHSYNREEFKEHHGNGTETNSATTEHRAAGWKDFRSVWQHSPLPVKCSGPLGSTFLHTDFIATCRCGLLIVLELIKSMNSVEADAKEPLSVQSAHLTAAFRSFGFITSLWKVS